MVDGWKLHPAFAEESGYTWCIDIIDYFSKFMGSFPVEENNAKNALNTIKEFCYLVSNPTILQLNNGLEYDNNMIDEFCINNSIKHIKSRPRHPQTNGLVEVVHKEIRELVLLNMLNMKKIFKKYYIGCS